MSISSKEENCLEVSHLKKYFELKSGLFKKPNILKAVDDVSFSIAKGETMGLVGESGCGKTTIGRTVLKLYEPTAGQIIYKGSDISRLNDTEMLQYRRKMQMIFQDPYTSLDPRKTVMDIIAEPIRFMKLKQGRDVTDRVRELVELVGLKQDHLNRYPHEFSGGQRQRVGIARALAAEPEFIVCDEPISALDVSIQAQIINILEELQERYHFTYLFISHDLAMVRHISDQIGVMYLGNLLEYAEVDELYENMQHPYTKALISAEPIADPDLAAASHRIILEGDVSSPINPKDECPFCSRCRYAKDVCRQSKPELKKINDKHYVACHLI